MPKHYLYNPIVLPNHVNDTEDAHVANEITFYRNNHDHEKIIRDSNVRLNWALGGINLPNVATKWGAAFAALNVNMGARGNAYTGTFNPENYQKVSARRHTKWYKFGAKKGPLGVVSNNDLVNINGHGNASGMALSYKVKYHNRWDYYSISQTTLANQIIADGLSKKHRWLRLAICFGGGVENEDMLVPAFAQRLAVALGQKGYKHVVVGGYTGATLGTRVVALKEDGVSLNVAGAPRAQHIKWYNQKGLETQGPAWV